MTACLLRRSPTATSPVEETMKRFGLRAVLAMAGATAVMAGAGVTYAGVAPEALPAGVYFQEDGHVVGWDNKNPKPQKKGVIRDVKSPTYKGNSAIETQQTYVSS